MEINKRLSIYVIQSAGEQKCLGCFFQIWGYDSHIPKNEIYIMIYLGDGIQA